MCWNASAMEEEEKEEEEENEEKEQQYKDLRAQKGVTE